MIFITCLYLRMYFFSYIIIFSSHQWSIYFMRLFSFHMSWKHRRFSGERVKFLKSTHRVNVNNLLFYFWVPRHVNLVKNDFIFILISYYSDSIEVDNSDNSKEITIEVDLVSTLLASRYICLSLVFKNPSSLQ